MKMGYRFIRPPVTKSGIGMRNECERKAFWREALGLVRRGVLTSDAYFVGECLHEGMRLLSNGAQMVVVDRRISTLAKQELDRVTDESGIMPVDADKKVTKNKALAIAMAKVFHAMIEKWREKRGEEVTVLHVEKEVRVAIPNKVLRKFGYRGQSDAEVACRLDQVCREKIGVIIDDYKTTSDPPTDRAKTAYLEVQPYLYRIAQAALDEEPAVRFRNFVIQKPGIRLKKTESMDEYIERMFEWYDDYNEAHPDNPAVAVAPIHYDDVLYPEDTMRQVVDFWRAFHNMSRPLDARRFPMTGAPYACKRQGRWCPYFDLCYADPITWPDTIALRYRQEFRYAPTEETD